MAVSSRVTVGELVGSIERRQQELDSQEEEVQAVEFGILQADWLGRRS